MTSTIAQPQTERKAFKPGTTGWSADDLDDSLIERQWDVGNYEIVEGVLTIMPPAYFDGSAALSRLVHLMEQYLATTGVVGGAFGAEADLVIGPSRVPRPDMVYLSEADLRRQKELNAQRQTSPSKNRKYGRLLVPPTLIIESVSEGHEVHDTQIKQQWYAQFGVPNYWLLDAQARTLDCLVLKSGEYQTESAGKLYQELRPTLFPGLIIPLKAIWL